MPIPIESFFAQNAWATGRLIDVCEQLPDDQLDASASATTEAAYGSIRDTLVHLLSAEQYYISRLDPPGPAERVREGEAFPGFETLKRVARANGEALARLAASTPADTTIEGNATDTYVDIDATVFLVQAINHSTEHRTQVLSMLSALGAGPADFDAEIDGWSWGEASGALRPKRGSG